MLVLKVVKGRHELLHPCGECRLRVIHPCGDVVEPFVHGEAEVINLFGEVEVIKLLVGVDKLFVHGGAPCVELIPRHGHQAKGILWKERCLENYNWNTSRRNY
jgi:hypothetical protein